MTSMSSSTTTRTLVCNVGHPRLPNGQPNWTYIDLHVATKEVITLTEDLESVGFQTEIRAGYEESLLVFVKAPRNILGTAVYNSRYGSPSCPQIVAGEANTACPPASRTGCTASSRATQVEARIPPSTAPTRPRTSSPSTISSTGPSRTAARASPPAGASGRTSNAYSLCTTRPRTSP